MTEVWKSQGRYFCEICKVWMADNRVTRDIHENGMKHKESVKQKIKEQTEKARKNEKAQHKAASSLAAMEKAALESMRKHGDAVEHGPALPSIGLKVFDPRHFKDISSMASEMARQKRDKTSRNEPAPSVSLRAEVKAEPAQSAAKKAVKTEAPKASTSSYPLPHEILWVEADAENGTKYYWHMYTGETTWTAPEQFFSTYKYEARLARVPDIPRSNIRGPVASYDSTVDQRILDSGTKRKSSELDSEVPEKLPRVEVDTQKVEESAETAEESVEAEGIPLPDEIPLPGVAPAPHVKTEPPEGDEEDEATTEDVPVKTELDNSTESLDAPSNEEDQGEPGREPEVAKPTPFGSWVKVKKVEQESSGNNCSPLTFKYRAQEERERKAQEAREKNRQDAEPKITFEEKTATVMTKKVKTIEFKKKSGPKNIRQRDA